MEWQPHVTVATVVEKDGKYLLVEERCNGELVFNQPAGHLDPNETLEEAAVRETFEETGWHVKLKGVVGVALYTSPHNQVTYHRTTFYATAEEHDPQQTLDDGIQQAVWMSYEEMQANSERMRSHLVIQSIEQYQQGHRYPINLVFG
ncbi:MAG: NUDIX hydrolase [Oceanicoccus sp.]|uniref:NUDIX hydrolase n=1 Tax=Oceanicoccus sp. TaxID=2691044 RepID=UPI002632BFCC|nr:NUDIX hydrolase [Oceanicoccus sp.]MCP3908476.1 NUDIX hydrolase [Oceanicoccus sp.]MDG1773335.1 NUDIX hydrolase [Oceanicoccus sp.]